MLEIVSTSLHSIMLNAGKRSMKYVLILILSVVAFGFTGSAEMRSQGMASSYPTTAEGQLTASGELYSASELTACHASLPFGTMVRVTNLRTNESVEVRINDRFQFKTNRVIDLSAAAAKKIHLFDNVAPIVSMEVIEIPKAQGETTTPSSEG